MLNFAAELGHVKVGPPSFEGHDAARLIIVRAVTAAVTAAPIRFRLAHAGRPAHDDVHDLRLVRDQEQRRALLPPQPLQLPRHADGGDVVQPREGLVEHNDLLLLRQLQRQGRAAGHPPGEFGRALRSVAEVVQPDRLEEALDGGPLLPLVERLGPVLRRGAVLQRHADVAGHRQRIQQRRLLEQHAHSFALRYGFVPFAVRNLYAQGVAQHDLSLIRREYAGDVIREGGLSRPGRSREVEATRPAQRERHGGVEEGTFLRIDVPRLEFEDGLAAPG
mmetsp:Transcript_33909/g.72299  ORF Transcript_33909/g.72299 Transcript_33909/m.72299 type:complete len:277 (-) Transcript_33909:172-1002(-)